MLHVDRVEWRVRPPPAARRPPPAASRQPRGILSDLPMRNNRALLGPEQQSIAIRRALVEQQPGAVLREVVGTDAHHVPALRQQCAEGRHGHRRASSARTRTAAAPLPAIHRTPAMPGPGPSSREPGAAGCPGGAARPGDDRRTGDFQQRMLIAESPSDFLESDICRLRGGSADSQRRLRYDRDADDRGERDHEACEAGDYRQRRPGRARAGHGDPMIRCRRSARRGPDLGC